MEERTDPRLLMLLFATLDYVEAKNKPVNPFVKGFGVDENQAEAYDFLLQVLKDCEDYLPELEEFLATVKSEADTLNQEKNQV